MIREFSLKILGLIIQLLLLISLIIVFYLIYEAILKYKWDIIPLVLIIRVVYKRLLDILWVLSNKLSDNILTEARLANPNFYITPLNYSDKVNMIIFKLIPNLTALTEFGKRNYSFNLWSGVKLKMYLYKTLVWTLMTLSFLILWVTGILKPYWSIIGLSWFILIFISTILIYLSYKKRYIYLFMARRIPLLNLDVYDLVERITFKFVNRETRKGKRFLICITISVIGMVVIRKLK